jgi:hypothetical protein
MAYIGKQPIVGNFVKLDAITTSATTTFNLTNGGVAYYPQTANNCIVSLNGVIQSPTSAYTISGSTIVFSDALTSSDTIDFILVLGDVLSIGTPSDGTITSAKLATGVAGLISWQSVQTSGFTAVAGRGYPCNTTSAAFTVTLPASPSAGDEVIILDYAGTFDTNKLTISPNGNKIEGGTSNQQLTGEREGVRLVYIDSTQGWLAYSGINEGTDALEPTVYSIDFLVVAGGGGGATATNSDGWGRGGGGGGGFRTSTQSAEIGTVITVTVGDGGAVTTQGSNSSISGSGLTTITSAGGGAGGLSAGGNGGSGGGSGDQGTNINTTFSGGSGNTPSTSPSQGNNGGSMITDGDLDQSSGAGGGGAGQAGENSSVDGNHYGGDGGNGAASSITGSSVTYAGGGGGGGYLNVSTGGTGGGGDGANAASSSGTAGTTNTGGGGGGGGWVGNFPNGGGGGKGVVILSVPTTRYSGTTTGSPTVTTSGSNTILQFNGSGSYTA